jgi:hypothetical protein
VQQRIAANKQVQDSRVKTVVPAVKPRAGQASVGISELTELTTSPIEERTGENFDQLVNKESKRKMKIPNPNDKGAPKFDPVKAVELARYFDQVDEIISENSIKDEEKKKNLLGRYAPATTEMEWKAFDTYKKGTYEDYKKEIMESYPEAAELEIGSLARMNAVTRPYIIDPVSTYDLSRLLALKRGFCAEAVKLARTPTLLSNRELVNKFTNCLESSFVRNIVTRLCLIHATKKKPAEATVANEEAAPAVAERRIEDRFDLTEVINIAVEIAKEMQNPFGIRAESAPAAPVPTVKVEDEERSALWKDSMEVKFKNIESSLDTTLRKVNELSVLAQQTQRAPAVANQRPTSFNSMGPREPYSRQVNTSTGNWNNNNLQFTCFYCRMPGHLLRNCPEVDRHLRMKWVVRTENSVQFADGTPIRGDVNTSMKDIVDRLNQSKTILTKPASAVSQNYLEEQENYVSQYSYGADPEHELVKRLDELSQLHGREALERVLALNSLAGYPSSYESDLSSQNF